MKKRLDLLLVERGLASGRDRAKALIMAGGVYADGRKADKPGEMYPEECELELRIQFSRYVSRGGLKLEKALEEFGISPSGLVCADIGASTGGFTDCLIKNGAQRVYAVDVGYGQLAWSLRSDPRVVALERVNARYLSREQIPEPLDFATADVSFISLSLVLPAVRELMTARALAVCLVKPQFEAGRDKVGKRGVVRDAAVHREVLERVCADAAGLGFCSRAVTWSPITGPKGNIEYLLLLENSAERGAVDEAVIAATVGAAHEYIGQ